jgi:hypothetical protein
MQVEVELLVMVLEEDLEVLEVLEVAVMVQLEQVRQELQIRVEEGEDLIDLLFQLGELVERELLL